MKHFVLLKFKSNFYNEEVYNYTKNVFYNISKLDNIENVQVFKNCNERDSNVDIMVEMKVKDKDALAFYLQHDLHRDFVNRVDNHLALKITFDCE